MQRLSYVVSLWQATRYTQSFSTTFPPCCLFICPLVLYALCCRWFQDCFSDTSSYPMPQGLAHHLCDIRTLVEEEMGQANGSLLYFIIQYGGGACYAEKDMSLTRDYIKAVAILMFERMEALAKALRGYNQVRGLCMHPCSSFTFLHDMHNTTSQKCSIR
jgi:hypothetical protein